MTRGRIGFVSCLALAWCFLDFAQPDIFGHILLTASALATACIVVVLVAHGLTLVAKS